MKDKEKIAAAISAVWHHITTEEETINKYETEPVSHQVIPGYTGAPTAGFSPWRSSGRQAQMQMRNMMQMRTFQASKLE
ncbi:MAG: hypothetical protein PVF56_13710 [Desulfobacterales bacterium]|jgi:hypothetical protein